MKNTWNITEDDKDVRVDVWLTKRIDGASRSRVQRCIKTGAIKVNGKVVTPHRANEVGDLIEADITDEELTNEIVMAPRPKVVFNVIHEDADIVVLEKPSGLLVHPAVPQDHDTLAHGLIARYPEIAHIGDSIERPGIVHRLDKEASGLMVIARTKKAYTALKKAFQAHKVEKEYSVLVYGGPSKDDDTVDFPIGRKSSGGKMAARPNEGDADKKAITHFHVEERFGTKAALLTVRTETGRTHQVRVHMLASACPVVGDTLYGNTEHAHNIALDRLFLHAKHLAFTHPITKKKVSFDSPLPPALETVLKTLRQ